ncbi:MAG: DNA mismatch repair protein MutS [Candidatus Hydrogenedens sp.]|nr:DNA mismatch repair protein MutS [Candidatus Hydrogenedens sp.]
MSENWVKLADVRPDKVTPMVRQFIEAKAESGDSLLFFRMGDFYELFFEDALEAAELLGLTLTSRDGSEAKQRIPMAGVPCRAMEGYVAKAIAAGRTVSICDQMEDPKDAKGIVKRAVTRIITPGTVTAPDLLDESSNSYLAAMMATEDGAGLAFIDVTTGEFLVARVEEDVQQTLMDEFARMAPKEVLAPESFDATLLDLLRRRFPQVTFTTRSDFEFDPQTSREMLLDLFELNTLKGVGLEAEPQAAGCAGAALSYVRITQCDAVPHLRLPRRYSPAGYVVLDGNTQRNLELVESLAEKSKRGTLLGVLDRTRTSMGARKMRHWLLHPLLEVDAIRARLNAVEALLNDTELRLELRELLKGVADLERLMGRLTSKSGNARDMKALGDSLARVPALKAGLARADADLIRETLAAMDDLADVAGWIAASITDEPPLALNEGNLLRDGYHEELDRLRGLVRGGKDWIAELQKDERARTGINTLKVGYNRVFGYFIEISKGSAHLAPKDYQRKQTLANAERFVTPSLKEREEEIINAQERMQTLEYDLFTGLRQQIAAEARRIYATAEAIATADVLAAFAETAATRDYCKPDVNAEGRVHITDGRHPVVESLMKAGDFVPNDTLLDSDRAALQIVTGPNMAGKSTYLRQVALVTLMAQVGSYVPARAANIGVVDRIFTRVGASDNLVRGESTFMVEMIETANILNTATERSLLVLDEIGRGTSTFDGISIAWSVAEHIHDRIRAKTLFATHYHELTELGTKLERAKNLNVAVREWGDKVVFLYRIIDGGADHSYGIQVAKLAGLPPSVISRARTILESLESGNTAAAGLPEQMYLFGATPDPGPSAVEKELDLVDPDQLSPKEAHELLYHLKHLANKPRDGK